jgi:urea transport system substrate-binding protein
VRKAAAALGAFDTPMGKGSRSLRTRASQKAYIGKLKADGQFEIISSSPAEIQPEPYDPLAFPGKTCKL